MARKVYISVLGTGNYRECIYSKNDEGFKSSSVRFVQQATLEYWKCNEWKENDVLYFLLTDGSRKKNWQDVVSDDGVVTRGLESKLKEMNIKTQIKPLLIEDGSNESEIMDIFTILYNSIGNGDDVYVDLTHGFRYLPMLILVFCNYAKFLKNVTCDHLVYGNWENRNAENEAPLIDMYPLVYLQQWTNASENFINSGNTDKLQSLVNSRLSLFKGNDMAMRNVKPIMKRLSELVGDLVTCQGLDLIGSGKLSELRKELSNSKDMPKPFIPLVDKIRDSFSEFSCYTDEINGFKAAKWCFDHKLYQQAITLAQESAITCVCKELGLDWGSISARETASILTYLYYSVKSEKECDMSRIPIEERKTYKEKLDIVFQNEHIMHLMDINIKCTEMRNQYNHAGMLKNKRFNSSAIIKKMKDIINSVDNVDNKVINNKPLHKYFINISNHPYESWDEKQLIAARKYGELVEIPFPEVPTDADIDEIEPMANKLLKQTIEISHSILSSTVHVMGEMTLTYCLVSKLTEYGFNCVASTTKRVTEDIADGKKISRFVFVKFRNYN